MSRVNVKLSPIQLSYRVWIPTSTDYCYKHSSNSRFLHEGRQSCENWQRWREERKILMNLAKKIQLTWPPRRKRLFYDSSSIIFSQAYQLCNHCSSLIHSTNKAKKLYAHTVQDIIKIDWLLLKIYQSRITSITDLQHVSSVWV